MEFGSTRWLLYFFRALISSLDITSRQVPSRHAALRHCGLPPQQLNSVSSAGYRFSKVTVTRWEPLIHIHPGAVTDSGQRGQRAPPSTRGVISEQLNALSSPAVTRVHSKCVKTRCSDRKRPNTEKRSTSVWTGNLRQQCRTADSRVDSREILVRDKSGRRRHRTWLHVLYLGLPRLALASRCTAVMQLQTWKLQKKSDKGQRGR